MKSYKHRLILEQLEERIVLDAAAPADPHVTDTHTADATPVDNTSTPVDTAATAATPAVANKTVIKNGSFEHDYNGWKLTDQPIIPPGANYPWLSLWGITDSIIPAGKFNSPTNPKDVTNPMYDQADNYALVPVIAPDIDKINFSPTDGKQTAFVAENYNAHLTMEQNVVLPQNTSTLELDMLYKNYWSSGYFDDGAGGKLDQYLAINIIAADGIITPLAKTGDAAATQNMQDQEIPMTHFSFDMTKWAGQSITIQVDVAAERTLLVAGFDNFYVTTTVVASPVVIITPPVTSEPIITFTPLVDAPITTEVINWVVPPTDALTMWLSPPTYLDQEKYPLFSNV